MSDLQARAQAILDAAGRMTPGPWYCEVDGWPVYDYDEHGNCPYYSAGTDKSDGNPYRPHAVSFDTLESLCVLRNDAPGVIRDLMAENERLQTLLGGGTLTVGGLEKKWFAQAEPQPFRDDEPVTPEMVERLGWFVVMFENMPPIYHSGKNDAGVFIRGFVVNGELVLSVCSASGSFLDVSRGRTFGQLAALCRGLGIPCEVKDE